MFAVRRYVYIWMRVYTDTVEHNPTHGSTNHVSLKICGLGRRQYLPLALILLDPLSPFPVTSPEGVSSLRG